MLIDKMRNVGFGISLLILGMLTACTSPVDKEPRPVEPSIRVLSLAPGEVQEFVDDLELIIEYLDYDGDIGHPDPDEKTLWVQDSRLDAPDWYHVPPIAPVGQEVPIEGTFIVPLNRLFLLGNGQEEEVYFTIKLKDRAGNWSEEEISPTVKVTR
ncbi:MAG: hypothetical protein AB8H47_19235 [Bacteroidia bacterium]